MVHIVHGTRIPPMDKMSAVSVKPPVLFSRKSASARVALLRVPAQLPAVQRQTGASRTASIKLYFRNQFVHRLQWYILHTVGCDMWASKLTSISPVT